LHKNIIIVEGENDRIFLHELVINRLKADPNEVAAYPEVREFERDVNNDSQKYLSIVEGGGSEIVRGAIRIIRPFWYVPVQVSIGVVGDLDSGPVYAKLTSYLEKYLKTICKVHVFIPTLLRTDSKKRFILKLKKERVIPIWTFDIPNSLEIQIARSLKKKYSEIKKNCNEDETIKAACKLLKMTKEDILRSSVELLGNQKWLIDLKKHIKQNI
jgi:hypothetical protein